jgi:hypothetical protein
MSDVEKKNTKIRFIEDNGELLYKFTPLNVFALQTLVNNTLFFCKPEQLNDILDSAFQFEVRNLQYFTKRTIKHLKDCRPNWPLNLEYLSRNLIFDDQSKIEFLRKFFIYETFENNGICSFSKIYDENLLWAHYANQSKGLCIVFNQAKLINSLLENLYHSEDRNTYFLQNDFVRYRNFPKHIVNLRKNSKYILNYSNKHFFTKSKHWKYEKEYRIVLSKELKSNFQKPSSETFLQHLRFHQDAIEKVFVGERMDPNDKNLLINIKNRFSENFELSEWNQTNNFESHRKQ